MLRANRPSRAFQKRTIRPLYHYNSAVPFAAFLDTVNVPSTTIIYPGMVAAKTTGEQMKVSTATTAPFGLFNNFIHGDMDELGDGTEIGVWIGSVGAVFEVLAGPNSTETPLDPDVTWTNLNSTANVGIYADADGRLTVSAANGGDATASSYRVATLIEAVSNSKIVIRLDIATAAGL
jgi:hypothetical protein